MVQLKRENNSLKQELQAIGSKGDRNDIEKENFE